ncbi:MAG: hypothetical protein COA78_14010 [Blastopirellula sp.]|nr:MAG: hypothetical protein COA78_14010 [Blastopirellula sp.]
MFNQGTNNYQNPVVLSGVRNGESYTSLVASLSEFSLQGKIVGFSQNNFYSYHHREAKSGYYEMICYPSAWSSASSIQYERFFSIGSVLIGFIIFLVSFGVFYAGWIAQSHTGTAVYILPILGPIAGVVCIIGARRLRLAVLTQNSRYCWVAPPLYGKETELRELLLTIPEVKSSLDDAE